MASSEVLDSVSTAQQTFKTSDERYLQDRARCWIGNLLGQELPNGELSLLLQNGRILALVADAVTAACKHTHFEAQAVTAADLGPRRYHRQLDDINCFLEACVQLGMVRDDLPALTDIARGENVAAVCRTLCALANKGTKRGLQGFPAFASIEEATAARRLSMSRAHSTEKAKQFDSRQPQPDGSSHVKTAQAAPSRLAPQRHRIAPSVPDTTGEVDHSPCTTPRTSPLALAPATELCVAPSPQAHSPGSSPRLDAAPEVDGSPCTTPLTLPVGLYQDPDKAHPPADSPSCSVGSQSPALTDDMAAMQADASPAEASPEHCACASPSAHDSFAAARCERSSEGDSGTGAASVATTSRKASPSDATLWLHAHADSSPDRLGQALVAPSSDPTQAHASLGNHQTATDASQGCKSASQPAAKSSELSFSQSLHGCLQSPASLPPASLGLAFSLRAADDDCEYSPTSTLDMFTLQRHSSAASSAASAADSWVSAPFADTGDAPAAADGEQPSAHKGHNRRWWAVAAGIGALAVSAAAVRMHSKQPKHYVVSEGDTLLQVSRKHAPGRLRGEAAYERLLQKNPHLADNPDLIFPATRIAL